MSKTTALWMALFALVGFALLTLCLLVVIGALVFTRTPAVSPRMATASPPARTIDFLPTPADTPPAPALPEAALNPAAPLPPDAPALATPISAPPAPPTPRAAPAPAPAAAAPTDLPRGYALVNATPLGKAMSIEKPAAANLHDALEAGLDDLDDYFDADYDVTAELHARDNRSGMSYFAARYKGKDVKGFVMARMKDKGALLVIVFANATATAKDWNTLTSAPGAPSLPGTPTTPAAPAQVAQSGQPPQSPARGGPTAPPAPAPANPNQPLSAEALAKLAAAVPMQTYRFPDGTGTVGLAPGWTTTAQSCHSAFVITGPNGQKVSFGMVVSINTPNSTAVQLARQYGTGGVPLVVAPWADPASTLNTILPQLSAIQTRNGGPAVTLDHLATLQKLPPVNNANSQNALLSYGTTQSQGGRQQHYQNISQVLLTPLSNEAFTLWMTEMASPDASFQQDLPAMIAMVNSWKTDDAVMQQKTDQWVAQSNANFNAGQAANRDLQATYDRYNQAQATNSTIRSRAVDDFVETIRDVRDVQDTRTGETGQVNLGNANDIVNRLNENDPGRYIQVPLRDRADPLPPGR